MNVQELEKLAKESLGLDIAAMTAGEKETVGSALLKIIESAEALMRPAFYHAGFGYDIRRTPFLAFFELGMYLVLPAGTPQFKNPGRAYKFMFESTETERHQLIERMLETDESVESMELAESGV